MNRLIVVGAGGHGKVVADIALKNGYTDIYFLDDSMFGECMGFPIIGNIGYIEKLNAEDTDFVIGIGDNYTRKRIAQKYSVNWVSIVHPSAQIAVGVDLGKGTVVMANAVINPCAHVGEHCIINTAAIVEHDNIIGDYVHISPGAKLGGTVNVGDLSQIGIGSTVRNNMRICANCLIGAGTVVVNDIEEEGTYVGIPARKL